MKSLCSCYEIFKYEEKRNILSSVLLLLTKGKHELFRTVVNLSKAKIYTLKQSNVDFTAIWKKDNQIVQIHLIKITPKVKHKNNNKWLNTIFLFSFFDPTIDASQGLL